jgi:hypothetical protein
MNRLVRREEPGSGFGGVDRPKGFGKGWTRSRRPLAAKRPVNWSSRHDLGKAIVTLATGSAELV